MTAEKTRNNCTFSTLASLVAAKFLGNKRFVGVKDFLRTLLHIKPNQQFALPENRRWTKGCK